MAKKGKGTNSTRSRNARKQPTEEVESSDTEEALNYEFEIQRATQVVTDRYERMLLDKTNEHREEMKNFLEGQKYWVKPSLWARKQAFSDNAVKRLQYQKKQV